MKIILFDVDMTLLACSTEANVKGSEVMFKKVFGLDANEELINNAGKTEKGIIQEVVRFVQGLDSDQEVEVPNTAYQAWAEGTVKVLRTHPPTVLPGVIELLETLTTESDIKLGLLTGNSRFRAEIKLKVARLEKYFLNEEGVLVGAFGDISNKRADLIEEAKGKYGDGIYVLIDDSLIGAKMAKENNVISIMVATGKASVEELKEYSDYVFEDFGGNRWQEVVKVIKSAQPAE